MLFALECSNLPDCTAKSIIQAEGCLITREYKSCVIDGKILIRCTYRIC
jgi:hypothetical protein